MCVLRDACVQVVQGLAAIMNARCPQDGCLELCGEDTFRLFLADKQLGASRASAVAPRACVRLCRWRLRFSANCRALQLRTTRLCCGHTWRTMKACWRAVLDPGATSSSHSPCKSWCWTRGVVWLALRVVVTGRRRCLHDDSHRATVRCDCGHTFCFRCQSNAHAPATCEQFSEVRQRCGCA